MTPHQYIIAPIICCIGFVICYFQTMEKIRLQKDEFVFAMLTFTFVSGFLATVIAPLMIAGKL